MKTDEEIVNDFIKGHKLAVLSTVTADHLPESAVVGIAVAKNFQIIIGTFKGSRKYHNIEENAAAALVIGWEKGQTVQLEGVIEELSDKAVEQFEKEYMADMNTVVKYVPEGEAVFFKIVPKWLRYTDLSKDPWHVIEMKF